MGYDNIPEELKRLHRWVCWRLAERGGKPTKIPINPSTGGQAMSNNPQTWGIYDNAIESCENYSCNGIGYVFTGDGIVGIDIDNCVNNAIISEEARDIINITNSYTEFSQSGKGIHIICYGKLPPGKRRQGNVEMYETGRYFCMTGDVLDDAHMEIEERTTELAAVHAKYVNISKTGKKQAKNEQKSSENAIFIDDDKIIEIALNAKNGDLFEQLMNGNWKGRYSSQSEADIALCNLLAFYCRCDAAQMQRIFRRSGLYREKWNERRGEGGTYGEITIGRAIADCGEVYTSPRDKKARAPVPDEPPPEELPEIIVNGRHMPDVTQAALQAIVTANQSNPFMFLRGQRLVGVDMVKDQDGASRPAIAEYSEAGLRGVMARTARYYKVTVRAKTKETEYTPTNPPLDIVRDLQALPGNRLPFAYLAGITQIPIVRSNGDIYKTPGYDAESCLYYVPNTQIEICNLTTAQAIELINEPFEDFPFTDDASKANCLGLLLTVVLRQMITGPVPMAVVSKPQQGVGASLLANVCGVVATGEPAYIETMPTGRDKEAELRKRITSVLLAGRAQVVLDNIEDVLKSATLGALLTCTTWQDRALGENRLVTLPHRVVWICTGNNVQPSGDLPRRCYMIGLDAHRARPWQRTGFRHPDLLRWVAANRGLILSAVYKLALDWIRAGRPKPQSLPILGNFEEWAETIGGILHHAGVQGFLENLEEMYSKADQDDGWEDFLLAWWDVIGNKSLTSKELAAYINVNDNLARTLPENLNIADKGFTRQIGHALRRRENMIYPRGVYVERAGVDQRSLKWKCSKVS